LSRKKKLGRVGEVVAAETKSKQRKERKKKGEPRWVKPLQKNESW